MSGRLACFLALSSILPAVLSAQDRNTEQFDLALGLIKRGMHDDAARQLRRFIDGSPKHAKHAEACYRLGTCYLELQDGEKAIAAFRQALQSKNFELRAECRYRLGHTLMQNGDAAAAAQQFAALVNESGEDHYLAAPSLYAQGEALRKAGNDKDALTVYRRAAAIDKDKSGRFAASSLYQAGFIQLRRGEHADAEKLFATAADRFPKHQAYGECRFLQGEAALRGKRHDAAEQAFQQAVAAQGEFADDAAMGLGYCAAARQMPDRAVAAFRTVANDYPNSPLAAKALLEAGRTLYKDGKQADAEAQMRQLLAREQLPEDTRWPAHELRGLALLDLDRPEDAAKELGTAAELAKTDADRGRICYSLGEACSDAGDWKNALVAYGRCYASTTDADLQGDALYGQCLALHRLERYAESNDLVAEFKRKHGKHRLLVTAQFAEGENLFALEKYEPAERAYESVPADNALAGKAAFKRAWCRYLSGDFKTAAKRFAEIVGSDNKSFAPLVEESLSMEALAWLEGASLIPALKAADRYRANYPQGSFLARTERVAARVLKRQNKLKAAASRLAMAASVEKSENLASGDKLEYAEVLFKQGDFAAAKKAYEPLTAREDSVGSRAHEGIAWCSFELGEDEDCGSWIQRGLKHPAVGDGRPGLLELLSALHHRRQEWAEAEKVARAYLSKYADHPRAPELRYSLGVAQARADKLAEARATLEALRDVDTSRKDRVFYELAWVCRRMKDEAAALASFRRVAELSEDEDLAGEARLHIGESMLSGDKPDDKTTKAGLEWLAKVKGKYTARAQYLSGFTRFEKEQFPAALPHFDRIVALGPDGDLYYEAQFFAGECLFRQDKHKEAIERYGILLAKNPDHTRAQIARLHSGQSHVNVDRARLAAVLLQEFLERAKAQATAQEKEATEEKPVLPKSDLARANLWLGKAWQQLENPERAETAFQNVTDLTDSDLSAEAQFRIGECRASRGELSEAVDAFVKLSILYQHAEWVQRGLFSAGDCYVQLKQPKKAAKLYEELVQRFPKSELAKRAQAKLKQIRSM